MEIDVLELLDRPIAYHVIFVKVANSVVGGVFLSQAFYWQRRGKQDQYGWWWHTQNQWTAETGLSRRELETARKKLRNSGILEERNQGIPKKIYYRLNIGRLIEKIEQNQQSARNRHTCLAHNDIKECTLPPNKCGGMRHIPKTIIETKKNNTTTSQSSNVKYEEEYYLLGKIFGNKGTAPQDPDAWEVSVRRRIKKQGGLSRIDKSQLSNWKKSKKKQVKDIAIAKQKATEKQRIIDEDSVSYELGRDKIRLIMENLNN